MRLLSTLLASVLAAACGAGVPQSDDQQQDVGYHAPVRGMHMKHDASRPSPYSAPAGSHLTYYGGRINAATKAYVVLWGSGSYDSHISSSSTPSMLSFYNQVLSNNGGLGSLMTQYNTSGVSYSGSSSNQTFAHGSGVSVITISPSVTSSTIDDSQIQTELTNQIAAGHLPAPSLDAAGNPTTYYAIFFPPGKTITQGGSSSCVSGGFCAYHGTVAQTSAHGEYYYGVHPDMQSGSGCATGCGNSTTWGNYTSVASHELVEMMTDAEVGISGSSLGPPLAWYDGTNGEIGDICNAQQGSYTACDGQSYTIQYEFSNSANNCVTYPAASCGTTSADFTISATSPTIAAGSSGTSTVSTTVVGSSGTVSLSLSGVPAGITASLAASSVTAGSGTTINISVASTQTAGNYSFTVTGTEGSNTHSATVTVAVTTSGGGGGGSALTNGGFESGLSGWTVAGTATSVSGGHSGSYAAQVGSSSPTNGDSSVSQTFTAPSTGGSLSFWYKVVCPDSVTYDWATATLKDNTAGTTTTMLAKTCSNSGAWAQSSAATLTASHSYTLTLTSHDDNYAGDATYTLYDDVVIGAGGGGGGGGGANAIANGTFETGSLSSWTTAGTAAAVSGGHSGTYAARVGSTSPTNGDSSVSQTFTAASGDTKLTFWYKVVCPDSVTYDWATVTLKDNTAGTTATLLAKTCTNSGSWVQGSGAITAGHSYTLTLTSHDDNYAGDATYTLYDDVMTQ